MFSITLKFERNTKGYAVYKELGGINKLYLPKGMDDEVTLTIRRKGIYTHGTNAECPNVQSGEWTRCRGHQEE